MAEFNALQTLQDRGVIPASPESHRSEAHKANRARQVLGSLTEAEVDVLSSIRGRMVAAGANDDVEAHLESDVHGGFLW